MSWHSKTTRAFSALVFTPSRGEGERERKREREREGEGGGEGGREGERERERSREGRREGVYSYINRKDAHKVACSSILRNGRSPCGLDAGSSLPNN